MKFFGDIFLKAQRGIRTTADTTSSSFNKLPNRSKKIALLVFGLVMGGISFMLIIQALSNQENNSISIQRIDTPKDIYMKDHNRTTTKNDLVPVGKFKGEINGEFEAFYLAVDQEGNTYINHSPDFSQEAYNRLNGWEHISRQQLEDYKRQLHFLPARTKSMHH